MELPSKSLQLLLQLLDREQSPTWVISPKPQAGDFLFEMEGLLGGLALCLEELRQISVASPRRAGILASYHSENFLHRIYAYRERVLQFSNALLRLNISPKSNSLCHEVKAKLRGLRDSSQAERYLRSVAHHVLRTLETPMVADTLEDRRVLVHRETIDSLPRQLAMADAIRRRLGQARKLQDAQASRKYVERWIHMTVARRTKLWEFLKKSQDELATIILDEGIARDTS